MNKAHTVAPLSQKHSLDVDVALVLRATVARITPRNLWINTRFVWPHVSDKTNHSPGQACYEAGILWYECGDYDRAIAEFQAALQLDWRHEGALQWISIAERAANEAAEAAFYPSALELSGLNRLTQSLASTQAIGEG
jgi:tetratricopeptide (TPR) repeat protein